MKMFHSATSPFVRKVMLVAHELNLLDQIERLPSAAHPINRSDELIASNPLGQVPILLLDDGEVLCDSRVICEYLNDRAKGSLLPRDGPARWRVLTQTSLADGLLDAAVLARYEEALRPEAQRWQPWLDGQLGKVNSALDWLERHHESLPGRIDMATLSFVAAIGYLDFRFARLEWRRNRPHTAAWFAEISERPSVQTTIPA